MTGLPEGFVLDAPAATAPGSTPGLPDGFVLDAPAPAPEPAKAQGGDASAAIGMGIVDGVPIAGPYLKGGLTNTAAFLRSMKDGTSFADAKKTIEAFNDATAAEHPIANTVGHVVGGVAATAPLVAAAPVAFGAGAGMSLPARAIASAVTGGAMGGADAAARGQDAGVGAATGAVLGLGAPYAAAGIGKAAGAVAAKLAPAERAPAPPDLKEAAQAAYRAADGAGVQIGQPSWSGAIAGIRDAVLDAGIDRALHPRATAALSRFEQAAEMSPTLRDTDLMRRIAKSAASSLEPDERRIGSIMVQKLDDYIGGLQPADLVGGDAEVATKALGEARGLWGRARRAEAIDTAVENGELRAASSGSGGNAENAVRQEIRKILTDPKQWRGYSDEERALMARVVRGGPVQNIARLVGKLSPEGNGLMLALGLGATAHDTSMAALPIAGYAAKKFAERAANSNVQRLQEAVRSGGEAPVSSLAAPVEEQMQSLAHLGLSAAPVFANRARAW